MKVIVKKEVGVGAILMDVPVPHTGKDGLLVKVAIILLRTSFL